MVYDKFELSELLLISMLNITPNNYKNYHAHIDILFLYCGVITQNNIFLKRIKYPELIINSF